MKTLEEKIRQILLKNLKFRVSEIDESLMPFIEKSMKEINESSFEWIDMLGTDVLIKLKSGDVTILNVDEHFKGKLNHVVISWRYIDYDDYVNHFKTK